MNSHKYHVREKGHTLLSTQSQMKYGNNFLLDLLLIPDTFRKMSPGDRDRNIWKHRGHCKTQPSASFSGGVHLGAQRKHCKWRAAGLNEPGSVQRGC